MKIEHFEKDFLALTDYCIRGDNEQLNKLYQTMKNLVETRTILDKEVWYTNNIQNLALALGEGKDSIYMGTWGELSISEDPSFLQFHVETIGEDPEEFVNFLKYKFPDFEIFFRSFILFGEHHYTNDRDGVFFPNRFVVEVDGIDDRHYFFTKEEAKEYIESLIGRKIEPGEDFNRALFEWGEFRAELPIYFEYEIVE